jgi:transposase
VAEVPTYEQLVLLVAEQAATIARLEERVAELERQLGRNSRNSSTPPSKDPLGAPARGRAKGPARKPGRQPGAPGSALRLVEDPDVVVEHEPACCAGCGAGLDGAGDAGMIRRQVHDIPEVSARVVEHRLHRRACRCGTTTTATGPDGLPAAPASYGPNLRAFAVYLVVFQHVPVERAAQCIADVTGAHVSTGWVTSVVTATAEELIDTEAMIKALIVAAHLIHVDETSTNVAGKKCWLHVACTDALTAYYRHDSRGRVAVDAFGVLPEFHGTLVHDCLSVYDVSAYPDMAHALCGAHIARELTAAAETHPGAAWPGAALDALHRAQQRRPRRPRGRAERDPRADRRPTAQDLETRTTRRAGHQPPKTG